MFWHAGDVGSTDAGAIDELLEREDGPVQLEELLDHEEELIQRCRGFHDAAKLVDL